MPHKNYLGEKAAIRAAEARRAGRQMDSIRRDRPTQPPVGFDDDGFFYLKDPKLTPEQKAALWTAFIVTITVMVCIVIAAVALHVLFA